MSRTISFFVLSSALLCAFAGGTAHAVQRTHVSAAFGADANTTSNCSATAPCRFFQAAMTVTDANGEVVVLDSGGYGAVTITQSVSLTAPVGVYAGISVFPGANGVNIATSGVNVVLRGITINGQGGNYGVSMTNGTRLSVENCLIANMTGPGVFVNTSAVVRVTDTIIRDNGGEGLYLLNGARGTVTHTLFSGNNYGVLALGTQASTTTTIDIADSTMDGNYIGVSVYSTNATAVVRGSVRDSRALRNSGFGLTAQSNAGAAVTLAVSNNIVSNNEYGVTAFVPGARVWASGNTISGNRYGFHNPSAVLESAGNNALRNNTVADVSGNITFIATQ